MAIDILTYKLLNWRLEIKSMIDKIIDKFASGLSYIANMIDKLIESLLSLLANKEAMLGIFTLFLMYMVIEVIIDGDDDHMIS